MDIFIDGMGNDIAIYEIKATDWDRIKPGNRRRNLYRHWKQLTEYVEKHVEATLDRYGAPAYWFTEIRGGE